MCRGRNWTRISEVPVGFVVLKDGVNLGADAVVEALIARMRQEVGAFVFRRGYVVGRLPKTHLGRFFAPCSGIYWRGARYGARPSMMSKLSTKLPMSWPAGRPHDYCSRPHSPKRRSEAQADPMDGTETQAEEGCLTHRFFVGLNDPNTLMLFQEWDSAEALEAPSRPPTWLPCEALPTIVAGDIQTCHLPWPLMTRRMRGFGRRASRGRWSRRPAHYSLGCPPRRPLGPQRSPPEGRVAHTSRFGEIGGAKKKLERKEQLRCTPASSGRIEQG